MNKRNAIARRYNHLFPLGIYNPLVARPWIIQVNNHWYTVLLPYMNATVPSLSSSSDITVLRES